MNPRSRIQLVSSSSSSSMTYRMMISLLWFGTMCFICTIDAKYIVSTPPSNVPSTIQSDTPSSLSSDTPSFLASDTPSTVPSDVPSTTLATSSIPTTVTMTEFSEDALQLGLETLDLVGYTNLQSWTNNEIDGDDDETPNVLVNGSNEYILDNLLPYQELFDPDHFQIDGSMVTNIRSQDTFRIPIYRSVTSDGHTIQLATNEMGNISFAEIRVPDPLLADDIFYIPSDVLRSDIGEDALSSTDVLISFTSRDLNNDKFGNLYELDEVEPPTNRRNRLVRRMLDELPTLESSEANTDDDDAAVATICSQYQIVKIAVVYDASLCRTYGNMAATRNRIINIVASASLYYEREICTKLQLADIYSPDATCSSTPFTNQFNTESACRGNSNLLDDFSNWIRQRRSAVGIDSNAIVHLLTGAAKVTSTIGCAFTSSYCSGFPFGVQYATFSSNILAQAVVFAHEVAHNLGAPHITDSSGRFNYIMEASINSGSDGFGTTSSNTIRSYLSRVTCDTVQSSGGNPPTNNPPRTSPSPPVPTKPSSPTAPTTVNGCPTTPEIAAPKCISIGNVASGGYACYSLNQLLPKDCSNVRWSISTCNGITIRNSPRRWLSSNLTSLSSFVEEEEDDVVLQEDQTSLTFAPASGSQCSRSCVFSTKNRVCLLASSGDGGGSHVIAYRAVDRSSGATLRSLERTITIQNNSNNNSCRPANFQCT